MNLNEEIITKILNEHDIKNPNKLVKSAIQEFAFKYAQKLLLKTEQVSMGDQINETHVRVAYDLIHNIHTPSYELANYKHTQGFLSTLNSSANQLKTEPDDPLTVKLPIYGLRNTMTTKESQLGVL